MTVSPPVDGPCVPWATVDDVVAYNFLPTGEVDNRLLALHLQNASQVLYRKSGQLYPGTCPTTIRPVCRAWLSERSPLWWSSLGYDVYDGEGEGGGYGASLVNGQWFNGPLGGFSPCVAYDCGFPIARIDLGAYPVTEITAVKIDGAAISESLYRLDNWQYLVRTDGLRWPLMQHLDRADTETGTFSVAIKYGQPPPTDGVLACCELAAELSKHTKPGAKAELPLRATSIGRSGVTYNLADVTALLDKGKTGFYFVDLFLTSVNPNGLDRPPRVLTPDLVRQRHVGST